MRAGRPIGRGVRRRSGWAVLAAVAGVVLGGALAVRLSKRKQIGEPAFAPPLPPPAAMKADASRQLVRMAIGAAVVVVLALATVIVTRPDDNGIATPRMVRTPSPGPNGMYVEVTVPGPVGRHQRLVVTGDPGGRAEVGIKTVTDPYPDFQPLPGHRAVMFVVHVRNTGSIWLNSRLDPDAWVLDAGGANYRAGEILSLHGRPWDAYDLANWLLQPGWEADRNVGFVVPENARLTRLHIAVHMGDSAPTAEWKL